ncbi:membrane protein [Arenimonas soli]|uniref:Membrane protein n=1 Tax=Arenimonas soli TaxID=2269504 RepID=A0ABQ1HFI5_9GAMM|nr:RodZ domain-containing protein [Arenimonas soli]GGA75019.1 membrane protein [Arenimonas soli]
MTTEGRQEGLFVDPLGQRLRAARDKCGLTREQAGQQLRLPVAIIEAMEREDWQRLGAPIYVRSYLGSYLRLLDLPQELLQPVVAPAPTPALVPLTSRSGLRRTLDKSLRNVVYLVMTAVLVVPVVLVARHYQNADRPQSLTLEPDASVLPALDPAPAVAGADRTIALPAVTPEPVTPEPVMASMAPVPAKTPAPELPAAITGQDGLVLRFSGQSWLEVNDAQGRSLERALLDAGAERRYADGEVGYITLGNAAAVEVLHDGQPVNLEPFRTANVARFTVSSGGEPEPAR